MTKRPNPNREEVNKNYWDKIVKNFPVTDNCLILTLEGTSVGHKSSLMNISKAIDRIGTYKNIIVGSVADFAHIQVLNEQKMLEVGWIRQERVTPKVAFRIIFTRWKITTKANIKKLFEKKVKAPEGIQPVPGGGAAIPDDVAKGMIEAAKQEKKS
jgi:hypothetical protein